MALDVEALDPSCFASQHSAMFCAAPGLTVGGLDAALLHPGHPFLAAGTWRAFVATRNGALAARLVASVDPRQAQNGRPVGAIGFVAEGGDAGALAAALERARAWLRQTGAGVVRCPMRFSTWYGHRAISAGGPAAGGAARFAFEPEEAPLLGEALRRAGFAPAHRAVSLAVENERVLRNGRRHLARLRAAGYRDRAIDLTRLECELALLHRLASAVFRGNWAYGEISREEFVAFYAPLAARVDAELVRFVELAGEPVGFVFAVPDRDERFVFKTIGVLSHVRSRSPGIGAALVALVHELAEERGYRRGIHALMTEGSLAHRTSAHWGEWLRAYTTYERPVA